MTRVEQILKEYSFSEQTRRRAMQKKTEAGMITELSTISAFREAFPTDEEVFLRAVETMRLKANDTCVCGGRISKCYKRIRKRKYICKLCRRKISPLAETPLKKLKYPMHRLLEIAYWCYTARKGMATAMITRYYGGKYETMLAQRHRMHKWMEMGLEQLDFLPGIPIQVDEVFPPIPSGLPKGVKKTRGPYSEGVDPHLIMTQEGSGLAKVYPLDDLSGQTIQPIFHATIAAGETIHTDGKTIYNFLTNDPFQYIYASCNHSEGKFSVNGVHVNHAESYNGIAKTQIKHIHNGVSEKHVTGYMDEVAWSFSHRFTDLYQAIESLFNALPPLR